VAQKGEALDGGGDRKSYWGGKTGDDKDLRMVPGDQLAASNHGKRDFCNWGTKTTVEDA